MVYDVVVNVNREILIEAMKELKKVPCKRKQPIFNKMPHSAWSVHYVCGTNDGEGSNNGYGVSHRCRKDCDLRIIDKNI